VSTTTTSSDTHADEQRLDPYDVCTLESDAREVRLAWLNREILPHALSREARGNTVRFELTDAPGLEARLERLVELERECCAGIEFAHGAGPEPGSRWLEIRGVDAESILGRWPDPATAVPRGLGSSVARAAGVGTMASLFVCCVLPIVATAVVGGASAASLASLDQPVVIAGVAVAFGAAAFAWSRCTGPRRAAAVVAREPASGCGCATESEPERTG